MNGLALFALAGSVAAAGLFTGLMMTLVVLMEDTWNQQEPTDSIRALQTFLTVAKGHPVITVVTFAGVLLPLLALILLWQMENTPALILTGVGFVVFTLGVLGVTVRLNLPLYEVLMGLDTESPADDWQESRKRFYWLNRVRGVASGAAFLLFLGAMVTMSTS